MSLNNMSKAKENANAFAPYIPHLKEGVLRRKWIKIKMVHNRDVNAAINLKRYAASKVVKVHG